MARGSRWWNEPPWWAWAGMVVGAVALVVFGFVLAPRGAAPLSAGEVARLNAEAAAATATEELPVVAVLGDSWAEGTGAGAGQGLADQLAEQMGWRLVNLSQGGTGYITDAPAQFADRAPFTERIDDVVRTQADVVIVAGGLNDTERGYSEQQLRDAVTETLSGIREGLPDAKIVVLGPWWPNGFPTESATAVDRVIGETAADLRLPFISPIQDEWITGSVDGSTPGNREQFIGPDDIHPTQAGHDYLAQKLAERLRSVPGLPS